jgi:hypothetical protein
LGHEVAAGLRYPEKARQLRDRDVDCDAHQKAGDYRPGPLIGNPAELQQAADDQHGADNRRERNSDGRMQAGASGGENGKRTRENRSDRGVGPGR